MFDRSTTNNLAFYGCSVLPGQEYLLQAGKADIQFCVQRRSYDKGAVKLLIIDALRVYGYRRITFVMNVSDQQKQQNSQSFDFFSARVEM